METASVLPVISANRKAAISMPLKLSDTRMDISSEEEDETASKHTKTPVRTSSRKRARRKIVPSVDSSSGSDDENNAPSMA